MLLRRRSSGLPGLLLLTLCASPLLGEETAPAEITLKRIMADPDWIGNAPQNPYWADDGSAVYYRRKRAGEEVRDLVRLDLASGTETVVDDAEAGQADSASGDWSRDRRFKVYARQGDVFWKDVASGDIRQLTRTSASESRPHFLADERRVAFYRGSDAFVRDLDSGLEEQVAEIRLEKDPAEEKEPDDYLSRQQPRLLDWVRERRENEEAERERQLAARAADPTRLAPPFYLGEKSSVVSSHLSPDGTWMLLRVTVKKRDRGRADKMPNYISEDGYVSVRDVRPKVGTGDGQGDRLIVLDLEAHEQHELDLAILPGITDDPLAELRRQAKARREEGDEAGTENDDEAGGEGAPEQPADEEAETAEEAEKAEEAEEAEKPAKPRAVFVGGAPQWTSDGRRVALVLRSADNKDRWIAAVERSPAGGDGETGEPTLTTVHRLSDEAWINWSFNDIGWLDDEPPLVPVRGERYLAGSISTPSPTAEPSGRLTSGDFVVDSPSTVAR